MKAGTLQVTSTRALQKSAAPLAAYLDAGRALRNRIEGAALPADARAELRFRLEDEEPTRWPPWPWPTGWRSRSGRTTATSSPASRSGSRPRSGTRAAPAARRRRRPLVPPGWTVAFRAAPAPVRGGAERGRGVSASFQVRPRGGRAVFPAVLAARSREGTVWTSRSPRTRDGPGARPTWWPGSATRPRWCPRAPGAARDMAVRGPRRGREAEGRERGASLLRCASPGGAVVALGSGTPGRRG